MASLPDSKINPSGSDSTTPSHNPFNPANIFKVDGLVAVVTGGGTGIGLQIATALEHNGATVYIVGRRMDALEKAAKESSKFNKLIPLQCDITNRDCLRALAESVKARHGYIDLLVNNAGIARNLYPHPLPSPSGTSSTSCPSATDFPVSGSSIPSIKAFQNALWDTGSPEDFAETFATNVTAVYYTTIAFLDLLHQGNIRQHQNNIPDVVPRPDLASDSACPRPPCYSSQVLSISSSGSFRHDAKVLSPSYTLSKNACTHLGKLLANLLSPWGIRSNVLAPGVWPTEMTTFSTPDFKLSLSALADAVPLRRMGTQEDMAGAILFIASRAGAYVNGAVWLVDGGRAGSLSSS